jgi:ADP-heptose:LPS heptosyltransferase
VKRVCLVRLSAMGDVVQSLGAAQALLTTRPDLEIHFVTQAAFVPLLEGLGFASVVAHDRRSVVRGLRRTRAAMRALAPDCVVDLQGNWKSAAVCKLSGGPVRIGATGSHRRERSSAILLNRRIAMDAPAHPAAIAHELLCELEPDLRPTLAKLVTTDEELSRAADEVRATGLDPSLPFTVMIVCDPADTRAWPISAMARQAANSATPVLWLRGPQEAAVATPAGARVITHGAGELRRLVALGALVAQAQGRVLGPDIGAIHVLNAAGAATVVFFGPQDPDRTAPPGATVVTRVDGPGCVPCRKRRCEHPDGPICMDFTDAAEPRTVP